MQSRQLATSGWGKTHLVLRPIHHLKVIRNALAELIRTLLQIALLPQIRLTALELAKRALHNAALNLETGATPHAGAEAAGQLVEVGRLQPVERHAALAVVQHGRLVLVRVDAVDALCDA